MKLNIVVKNAGDQKNNYTMNTLSIQDTDRIIEMAWEDRTPFEAIEFQFGLPEKEVIELMRREMKSSSFKMWRKRTNGRSTKHSSLRNAAVTRFKCSMQKAISHNKISKR
jgi:uncharacterized protein (TIGR03643 family)